jgi:hypothetical protein
MNDPRITVRIPSTALRHLIGEGAINAPAFRRSRIERYWPCGCLADYEFDKADVIQWTPCSTHESLLPESERTRQ